MPPRTITRNIGMHAPGMRLAGQPLNTGAGTIIVPEAAETLGLALKNTQRRTDGVYSGTTTPDFFRPINQSYPDVGGVVTMTPVTTANRGFFTLFYVAEAGVLFSGSNYQGGGGTWRYAIYSNISGGIFPDTLLWDSGAQTPAVGPFDLPIGLATMSLGWYWFAGTCSSAASPQFLIRSECLTEIGVEADWNGLSAGSPSPRLGWFTAQNAGTAWPATIPGASATAIFYAAGLHFPTLYVRYI